MKQLMTEELRNKLNTPIENDLDYFVNTKGDVLENRCIEYLEVLNNKKTNLKKAKELKYNYFMSGFNKMLKNFYTLAKFDWDTNLTKEYASPAMLPKKEFSKLVTLTNGSYGKSAINKILDDINPYIVYVMFPNLEIMTEDDCKLFEETKSYNKKIKDKKERKIENDKLMNFQKNYYLTPRHNQVEENLETHLNYIWTKYKKEWKKETGFAELPSIELLRKYLGVSSVDYLKMDAEDLHEFMFEHVSDYGSYTDKKAETVARDDLKRVKGGSNKNDASRTFFYDTVPEKEKFIKKYVDVWEETRGRTMKYTRKKDLETVPGYVIKYLEEVEKVHFLS